MSYFNKICTGLFVSLLSLSAQAAVTGQPSTPAQPAETPELGSPDQVPGTIESDVSNVRTVIQMIHISHNTEKRMIELVRDRNPDRDLRRFALEMSRDNELIDRMLTALAKAKNISLEEAQFDAKVQLVGEKMDQEIQNLTQKPQGEFRAAFLQDMITGHEKAIEYYNRLEAESTDDALKAIVSIFRQVAERHLEGARKLHSAAQ